MKKRTLAILIAFVLLLAVVIPVAAVTDGEPDGEDHPHVVLLVADYVLGGGWRCSATLLSPTVVLTAGHCTGEPDEVVGMRIFTESDVDNGDNSYPEAGNNSIEASEWHTHPLYTNSAFFLHDVGVVILEEPMYLDEYGALPELNQLDGLKKGKKGASFTSVGYGLQKAFPDAASWKDVEDRIRYVSYPFLIQVNTPGFTGDFSLLLSNNHATGGTCYGDSGGPNFLGESNIVAGVTSYGMNPTCAGTGGVFRMDQEDVLNFVESFLE